MKVQFIPLIGIIFLLFLFSGCLDGYQFGSCPNIYNIRIDKVEDIEKILLLI